MKRVLIAAAAVLAASTSLAAPAAAQEGLPCKPLLDCVQAETAKAGVGPVCQAGDSVASCAERHARTVPDHLITVVFEHVNAGGYVIGDVVAVVANGKDTAEDTFWDTCARITDKPPCWRHVP
jgi:hypothetical protein